MTLYFLAFGIYALTALALGIGMVVSGRATHVGCQGQPSELDCKSKSVCGGVCRRKR